MKIKVKHTKKSVLTVFCVTVDGGSAHAQPQFIFNFFYF